MHRYLAYSGIGLIFADFIVSCIHGPINPTDFSALGLGLTLMGGVAYLMSPSTWELF